MPHETQVDHLGLGERAAGTGCGLEQGQVGLE
jgi:hypothetical protein